MMWIVGLGNPGRKYAKTRHNIGFMVVEQLAKRWNVKLGKSKLPAEIGETVVDGARVALVRPLTYMNLSGECVAAFLRDYKADVENLIVVYDDLDTEFGQLRLRFKGSAGGHNGVKSIIQHLGTEQFKRVRVGISRPSGETDIVDYVLSEFAKGEREQLPFVIGKACDALEMAVREPFEKVMARFNARP